MSTKPRVPVAVLADPSLGERARAYKKIVGGALREVLKLIAPGRGLPAVSIYLCSNREIRRLNRRWFRRDRPTNVISFPRAGFPGRVKELGPVPLRRGSLGKYLKGLDGGAGLGDIAIGVERAESQAKRAGLDPTRWILHLALHGLLHLLGYSHREMAPVLRDRE